MVRNEAGADMAGAGRAAALICLAVLAVGAIAMIAWVSQDDPAPPAALSGSVIIDDVHTFFTPPCHGEGAERDMHAGTPVVVRDGSGKQLATTVLEQGVKVGYHACIFAFVVDRLQPTDSVAIQVGGRNTLVFGPQARRGNEWNVEMQARGARIVNYS